MGNTVSFVDRPDVRVWVWVSCARCGRSIARAPYHHAELHARPGALLEIKCRGCKSLNYIYEWNREPVLHFGTTSSR